MKVASAARELTLPSDDTGLRTALRNVPLLPAPANVDDLLARLGGEEVPFSSGPLADLISDARYAEPAPAADDFFAPVSLAANSNLRARLARRLVSGAFTMALMAGVVLIVWNALVGPDASPPATPALDPAEATRRDLAVAAVLPEAAGALALATPEAQPGSALPPATPDQAGEPPAPHPLAERPDVAALPELEPVADLPELIVVAEAFAAETAQPEPAVQAAAPAALEASSHRGERASPAHDADAAVEPDTRAPEPVAALSTPSTPEPARGVELNPGESLAPEPAPALSTPELAEPIRDAEAAAPSDTVAAEASLAMAVPTMPQPTREAQAAPEEILAPEPQNGMSAAGPADPARVADTAVATPPLASDGTLAMAAPAMPEPSRASDPPASAADMQPEPVDLREPRSELVSQAEAHISPDASAAPEAGAAGSTAPDAQGASPETIVAPPAPPVRPLARERVAFAGTWAAVPEACAPDLQEDEGHLLARIGARGGRAGDTACAFKTVRRRANTWLVNAACSDGEASWRSDVRLSLTRGRLTWTSQKGSTTYQRCPRA